jgi:anti-sigma factor ChrR (cupin superfamily)
MRNVMLPTLNAGEIMAHDAMRAVGQVVETIYPADNQQAGLEQVLLFPDGTRQNFRLAELRPANEIERRRFAQTLIDY